MLVLVKHCEHMMSQAKCIEITGLFWGEVLLYGLIKIYSSSSVFSLPVGGA